MLQFSVQNNQLSQGYDAFNDANPADPNDPNWTTVMALFCDDTPTRSPKFPAWYPMDGKKQPIVGRVKILAQLKALRQAGVEATLLAVASQGNNSITLDSTTGGPDGPHACADKVEFDESGRIKVFWHCSSATHQHGTHAGHPAHRH